MIIHHQDAVPNVISNESASDGFLRARVQVLSSGQVLVLEDSAGGVRREEAIVRRQVEAPEGLSAQALLEFVKGLRDEPNRRLTSQAPRPSCCTFAAEARIRTGEPIDVRDSWRGPSVDGELADRHVDG